jgi:hypothetical protein
MSRRRRPLSSNVIRHDFGRAICYENSSCLRTFHVDWRHFLLATCIAEAFAASGVTKCHRDRGWRATGREAKYGHVAVLIPAFRVPVAPRRSVVVGFGQHGFA